ncbi:MAG: FAD-dependent oxidoreductase [Arcobacteraceae bacterium]|nr:FAD-dependent oxidoreductase [Arcobacteraceae bacterium]
MEYDVLIIGSGGAGLSCAIEAKRNGAKVLVLSKTTPTASQTCQAQGGINACLDEETDSIQNHINDTMKSSHKIGNSEAIKVLCTKAKDTILWLDNLAVPFSKDANGNIAQRKLGGTSNARACYSSDYTGLKILHTLYDTCIKENVDFIEDKMLLDLIVSNNTVLGAVVLDIKTTEVEQIFAKKVVLATGGYAGIYTNFNTNSLATTGDGLAVALRAGCRLKNMEYVQFHPTALKENSILISESARGEGGYLVTSDGERFIDELKPRDEVARAIYQQLQDNKEVFLDLRHLGIEKIMKLMPQEYNLALQYTGLKMDVDLIPIKPVAHYSMGGIKTDPRCHTNIKHLYAIGECAANGVHGANRLGGNSLLEIILFGRIAGQNASKDLDKIKIVEDENKTIQNDITYIDELFEYPNTINFYEKKELLGKILYENVGLFRNETDLQTASKQIAQWQKEYTQMGIGDKSRVYNTNLKEFIEFKNMLDISEVVILSAIERCESRGAHYRIEYTNEEEQFEKQSIVTKTNENLNLEFINAS